MVEVEDFSRKNLFEHYNDMESPFIIMTVPLDVTNVVQYTKVHKHFYATMGFIIGKAINEVEAFKYRYKDGKFYYCPRISPNFTERVDSNLGFFDCDSTEYESFIDEFVSKKEKLGKYEATTEERLDVVWLSCFPWASFSSLVSPHDKSITIPQLIWDKYLLKDGRYICNLMIMVHHGFADGYDVGKLIEKINYYIDDFK
ncbi:MAG: hypothetical protein E7171_02995 [Firmicutes bacterium]|nr:hypothetical protein [Bacillota bacterium]